MLLQEGLAHLDDCSYPLLKTDIIAVLMAAAYFRQLARSCARVNCLLDG